MIWELRQGDREAEARLVRQLGISPILARILVIRGIDTVPAAEAFLTLQWDRLHSPWLLAGMEAAAARIVRAIRQQEPVVIYGDYDVDGVTATALLVRTLRQWGAQVDYYIPDRLQEGYGLNGAAIEQIARGRARLLVTVDCGITAWQQAEAARKLGLDLIITDHHQPGERLPQAVAVINPHRSDCPYPDTDLAGVGVAFKLAQAVTAIFLDDEVAAAEWMRKYVDLVALGTVADVAPMRGENRILVYWGLKALSRTQNPGLIALKKVAGLENRELSTGQVSFILAPRINATGRMADASWGVRLLLTEDPEEAYSLARQLDASNEQRQAIEAKILAEAVTMVEEEVDLAAEPAIVLASPHWHPGVIGIVASRLVERYHRPTVLISLAEEPGKGSGRSIEGFNLHKALAECSAYLESFGGHKMAAGVSIRSQQVVAFRRRLVEVAKEWLTPSDLIPKVYIDAEVDLASVEETLVTELSSLEPYGPGNPQPVLMARNLRLIDCRLVGQDQTHLKLFVTGATEKGVTTGRQAIGFDLAKRWQLLKEATAVDMAFVPVRNEWNGRVSIDLVLRDVRPAADSWQRHLARLFEYYKEVAATSEIASFLLEGDAALEGGVTDVLCRDGACLSRVIDWRQRQDKRAVLLELLKIEGPFIVCVDSPRYAWHLVRQMGKVLQVPAGSVGLYHRGMLPEDRKLLLSAGRDGPMRLLVTAETVEQKLAAQFAGVVLYRLPPTEAEFYRWVRMVPGGSLYLAYNRKDVQHSHRLWEAVFPDREELARFYVALRQKGAEKQPLLLSAESVAEINCGLSWRGVINALRVLSELQLVSVRPDATTAVPGDETGEGSEQVHGWLKERKVTVQLRPSPENKLDLTQSVSYNECIQWRRRLKAYSQWALEAGVDELVSSSHVSAS